MNPSYLPDSINDWKDKTLKTVKGKAAEYTKHNGKYAAIYYCNDTSEVGIMIKLSRNGENYYKPTSFTAIGVKKVNGKYEKTSTSYVQDNCSDYTNLLEVSRKDVGAYKAILRSNKKDADNESVEESRKYIQDILHLYATRYLWPIIIKKIEPKLGYNNSITLDINIPGTFFVGGIQGRGGILPGLIRGYIIKNGRRTDYNFEITREKDSSKYNIEFFKDNELTKELNKVVNKMMSEYIRTIIKDKKLKNMRINDREGKDTKNRLQFENYFPY